MYIKRLECKVKGALCPIFATLLQLSALAATLSTTEAPTTDEGRMSSVGAHERASKWRATMVVAMWL